MGGGDGGGAEQGASIDSDARVISSAGAGAGARAGAGAGGHADAHAAGAAPAPPPEAAVVASLADLFCAESATNKGVFRYNMSVPLQEQLRRAPASTVDSDTFFTEWAHKLREGLPPEFAEAIPSFLHQMKGVLVGSTHRAPLAELTFAVHDPTCVHQKRAGD